MRLENKGAGLHGVLLEQVKQSCLVVHAPTVIVAQRSRVPARSDLRSLVSAAMRPCLLKVGKQLGYGLMGACVVGVGGGYWVALGLSALRYFVMGEHWYAWWVFAPAVGLGVFGIVVGVISGIEHEADT